MSKYIVDDICKVVSLMRVGEAEHPYYMYGHRVEISKRLTQMDQDETMKYKKYPLVALRLDIPETRKDGLVHYSLNLAILHLTEKTDNAVQRYEKVFKPILYPLYDKFWEAFKKVGLFVWTGDGTMPPHTKIDRPYWGTSNSEGNIKNIFSDPLDAIEIVELKFSQHIKTCK